MMDGIFGELFLDDPVLEPSLTTFGTGCTMFSAECPFNSARAPGLAVKQAKLAHGDAKSYRSQAPAGPA